MMQDRCAICDADNELRTLCEMHTWLSHAYPLVYTGGWSDWDWPPDMIGPLVSQQHMMHPSDTAHPVYWQASIITICNTKGVVWEDALPGSDYHQESVYDGLALAGWTGWRQIDGGKGGTSWKAA